MNTKSKTKSSILNAITSLLYIAVNGLLGLVFTHDVIVYWGSDFNGINSASFQLVNILMILEGGFTLATNVALFAPLGKNDYTSINGILSATDKRFKKIGLLFMILGVVSTLLYALVINTEVSYWVIVYVFLMSLLPPAINIYLALKYRAILLSDQKEYVISLITLTTVTLGYFLTIVAIRSGCGYWSIKAFTTAFAIINSFAIATYCRRRYKRIDFTVEPDYNSIKGTKDVFISKLSGALYTALPILVVAIAFPEGAKLASVYAVYASVFSLLSNAIQSFSSAPRFAFGQLWADDRKEDVNDLFVKYELIVFVFLTILLSTAVSLILPFVNLYTKGVSDIQYENALIAILLGCYSFISIIHIPSGHMINMSGNFKLSKIINLAITAVFIVLLVLSVAVGKKFGADIYGIIVALLLSELLLSVTEMVMAHKKILGIPMYRTFLVMFPNIFVFALSFFIGLKMPHMDNYIVLFEYGVLLIVLYAIITAVFNMIFNNKISLSCIRMLKK